jgi:hypothetical protein
MKDSAPVPTKTDTITKPTNIAPAPATTVNLTTQIAKTKETSEVVRP